MKRKIKVISIIFILLVIVLGYGFYWAFYDIQRIEGQTVLQEVLSPNEKYTVTAYLNNGGATADYAVLCSVKTNGKNKEKNIYPAF